ncbi:MAG: SagB/ThcOx family dehydrogenase [Lachnospiraceae bacterium]
MTEEEIRQRIQNGREFMKMPDEQDTEDGYQTDQQQKKVQPPLYKEPCGGAITQLPEEFQLLELKNDILEVLYKRKSSRVYTGQPMSLLQLSFLLWAQQGVKTIRGNNYATIRTVACGGARHEFECYIAVQNVEGLTPGYYHYMPDLHAVELIEEKKDMTGDIHESLCEQAWAVKANVVFYYSIIPYRAEWRYGIYAHRTALMDAGHITENLYVAASAAGVGTCAIASIETDCSNVMFHLEGKEEFIFYAAPAGMISEGNKEEEDAFYAFLKEDR